MALILGLDIATTTGFAWYDTNASLSAIKAGSFRIGGEGFEQRAGEMGAVMVKMLRDNKPDFIMMEQPTRNVMQHRKQGADLAGQHDEMTINAGTSLLLNQLTGAAAAIIRAYRIPFDVIPPTSWRKQFLGFGTHRGWQRKDWKRAARERCAQLKITVTNDDQADAVGVAFAGASSQTYRLIQAQRAA